ncbi:PIN domain-containing protein [Thermococcus sp. MAR1]|uniref:PIN domain-containing protein n=1 Tax=Thermococcus sp. MAR1 TaxID=1638263 RepID=UPI001438EB2E|nr:PIN domain-containing protein [Thermococcus sp. MAR1]NJE10344.1 type II toxin-antitoxin system VapC family toxin [Thermococcus sp. MAR1]
MRTYIDANIIYNFLFTTSLTPRARDILTSEDELVISPISINEAVYVSFRKLAKEKHGISNIYDVKRFVKTTDGLKLIETAFSMVLGLIGDAGIDILPDEDRAEIIKEVAAMYGLLPSDATILATCMKHGIPRIATFDSDFEGINAIEVIR